MCRCALSQPSSCGANDRWFQDICAAGEPEGARPASDKSFALPLAMPSPCGANDRWFQEICAAGEPEGARPTSDKIFALPLAMPSPCSANDRWFQEICIALWRCIPASESDLALRCVPPIPFLEKRINIPRVEYISAAKIRANRPQPYRQNSRQKIGTRSEIFSTHFFKKKEGNAQ